MSRAFEPGTAEATEEPNQNEAVMSDAWQGGKLQFEACDLPPVTCNLRPATDNRLRTTGKSAICNLQSAIWT
jgi:hypothetical protein